MGNVIDHYNHSLLNSEENDFLDYDDQEVIDDDDDVVAPPENQSMKTDAGVDSEIFEASPAEQRKEQDPEQEVDLTSSLRFLTDQLLTVTLLLGKGGDSPTPSFNITPSSIFLLLCPPSGGGLSQDQLQERREERSLHVDREIVATSQKWDTLYFMISLILVI